MLAHPPLGTTHVAIEVLQLRPAVAHECVTGQLTDAAWTMNVIAATEEIMAVIGPVTAIAVEPVTLAVPRPAVCVHAEFTPENTHGFGSPAIG